MPQTRREPRRLKLTEVTVRKAQPETANAYLLWDVHQRGLALRVQPTGGKAYYVVYSRHNRPRWLRLGDARAIGLADARVLAAEAALVVAKGGDPAAEKKAARSAGTFADLAAQYLEQYASKRNKSWKQAESLVRRYVLPRWAMLQASTLTRADVKALMASIEAPVLANQVLAAVSAIFSWAVREEILPSNPCKLVARNATKSRERVLAESEVAPFWKALDEIGVIRAAALRVILLGGQRPGEVAHMRREHVKAGWWEMPGEPVPALGWPGTKNGNSHRVWIAATARQVLAELDDGEANGYVFAGARGRAIRGLDAAMRSVCSKLGMERATPHDLRRTFSTTVTSLGFGREALNRVTNHREGGIASVYDRHGYAEENKRVMEAVAFRIMELVEGRTSFLA